MSSAVQVQVSRDYLVDAMCKRDKIVYWLLVVAWLTANLMFWHWWLNPEHVVTIEGLVVNSLLFLYGSTCLMVGWFLFFL